MDQSRFDDLRARYAGRISADAAGDPAIEMARLTRQLMAEWNPIHSSVAELTAIMGGPTRTQPAALEYIFDNGLNGQKWRYTLLGDIVVGVEWDSLE